MKKIIESDLIAIAHKILKMKDKSDVNALHAETQKLYEKLSVLKFYEENLNRFDQAPAPEKIEELLNDNNVDNTPKHNSNPMMSEEIIEELLEETQVEPQQPEVANEVITTTPVVEEKAPKQVEFEVDAVYQTPFEKVEFEEIVPAATPKNKTTVNDSFAKTITLTLNDRIAFEKQLFNSNTDDLNRVISQLNTMTDWDEAEDFINHIVKPDFNDWQGKEEYEKRFMSFVQKRFL